MSKIWVTNESSSFAKSLACWYEKTGKHVLVNSIHNAEYDYFRQDNLFREKEIDIFDPTLPNLISRSGAEIIIHQLPITPERCYTNPDYAIRNNVEGSYYVAEAAREVGIPVVFITTKNYNSIKNNFHASSSYKTDMYDTTALAVENIFDIQGIEHTSVVPPIIYGPLFDEGISGLIKASLLGKNNIEISLSETLEYPFMHIDDFCDALDVVVENIDLENNEVDKDVINIVPHAYDFDTITSVDEILKELDLGTPYTIDRKVERYSATHDLPNSMKSQYSWERKFSLKDGIIDVVQKIKDNHDC